MNEPIYLVRWITGVPINEKCPSREAAIAMAHRSYERTVRFHPEATFEQIDADTFLVRSGPFLMDEFKMQIASSMIPDPFFRH